MASATGVVAAKGPRSGQPIPSAPVNALISRTQPLALALGSRRSAAAQGRIQLLTGAQLAPTKNILSPSHITPYGVPLLFSSSLVCINMFLIPEPRHKLSNPRDHHDAQQSISSPPLSGPTTDEPHRNRKLHLSIPPLSFTTLTGAFPTSAALQRLLLPSF